VAESNDTDPLADTRESDSVADAPLTKVRAVRPGDVLGRYELVDEVGEGGMATVFRARDKELRREVAVKVLFHNLARRVEVVRRFQREARAAAGLDHPNILKIFDVGGGEGEQPPFIVMELIRGHSLLGEIEQHGPMLAELAACIGALLADALGAAHAAGIIHRDVKPANVLIANGGRVLLADFGVARLETEDSLVTKTGALLGTPAYMSPEQATGDTATARSDLYSLGAALYQLSTGHLPFTGPPAKVLAQLAQGGAVPAVKRNANVGPELSALIAKMMQPDAAARPESAAQIAKDLRAIATAGGLGDAGKELTEYFADRKAYLVAKSPAIVTAIIAAAERALADDKLPRALALADRATALAPDDPKVTALVTAVTEGGRAAHRKKWLAMIAAGVVVAGGATAAGLALRGGSHAKSGDAAMLAADHLGSAASPVMADAGPGSAAIAIVVADAAAPFDAAVHVGSAMHTVARTDAGRISIDAQPMIVPIDAAIAIDAAVREPAQLVVTNDIWCNLSIDGIAHGQILATPGQPIRVDPGHHVIVCEQPGTANKWTRAVEVVAGQTLPVVGAMRTTVTVTFGIDTTIDGTHYRAGQVAHLPAGSYKLQAGGGEHWTTLRVSCTVRLSPDLDCFP
jgi:hypothetical protein